MKRWVAILVSLASIAAVLVWDSFETEVAAADAYSTLILSDSPVGYWRMNDVSDSAGSNSGYLTGSVTTGVSGVLPGDSAMNFTGGGLRLPGVSTLQPTAALSIEAWVQTSYAGGGTVMRSRSDGYGLAVSGGSTGTKTEPVGYASGSTTPVLQHPVSVNDGLWHHLVFTADSTSSHLYVDALEVENGAGIGSGINYSYNGIAIGQDGDVAGSYFIGKIDEVALYNHALTQTQVLNHFGAAVTYALPAGVQFGDPTMAGLAEDPVETAHGNFHDSFVDLTTPSGVYGLSYERSYNSLDAGVSELGAGWRGSYSATASGQPSGRVVVTLDDGRVVTFDPSGAGGFRPPLEFSGTLSVQGDGSYRITFPGGEIWDFDLAGRVEARSEWSGQQVTVTRNGSGFPTALVSSTGPSIALAYAGGRLSSVTASDGRTSSYGYTSSVLTSVTDTSGGVSTYSVDGSGRITSIADPAGVAVVSNTYDGSGRVGVQTTPGGSSSFAYDIANRATTVTTSPGGDVVVYHHDALGRLSSVTDPASHTSARTYNSGGFLASGADRTGVTDGSTFDSHGNPLNVTDPASGTTTYVYDGSDRPTSVTSPISGTTTYGYDGAERIPSTVTDALSHVTTRNVVGGVVLSETDPDGVTTTVTYDAQQRPLTVADAAGHTTTMTYDTAGRLATRTAPSGRVESWTYDGSGRPLTATASDGGVTHHAYDAAGKPTTITDPTGAVTTTTYDSSGRVATVTPPGKPATVYAYDSLSQLTSVTEPGAATTSFTYGVLGRLATSTDPLNRTTTYAYDAAGRQTSVTAPDGGATTQTFDSAGRPSTASTPGPRTTTTTYKPNGLIDHVTDPAGAITSYAYDGLGRRTSTTDPTGVASTVTYSPGGRTATATDPATGTITNAYDTSGRMTTQTNALSGITTFGYDADGRTTSVTSPAGLVTSTSYDSGGRAALETRPDGSTTTRTWSTRSEVLTDKISARGTVTFVYNPDGTMASATNGVGGITTYGYDNRSRMTSQTDPTTAVTTWAYDLASQVTSVTAPQVSGQPVPITTYTYDPAGRIATVTDPTGRVRTNTWNTAGDLLTEAFAGGGAAAVNHSFTYDTAGRRIGATGTDGTAAWSYDSAGRSTVVTEPGDRTSRYAYDPSGRIATLRNPSGDGVGYTYDSLGRPTAITPTELMADTFTAPNTTAVDSKKWTQALAASATASVSNNMWSAQLSNTSGSTATLSSKVAATNSDDISMTYALADLTATNRAVLKVSQRFSASGAYRVEVTSDSATAKLFKTVGSTSTQLGTLTVPTASRVGLRFRVTGSTVSARLWDTSAAEPATWGYQGTDTAVTTAGTARVQIARTAGTNQLTLDDVYETDPASGPAALGTFGYDADGRVTSEALTGGSRTWTYTAGRPTALAEALPSLSRSTAVTYDAAGSIATEATAGITTTYGYDNAGQLKTVTPSTGNATTFTYSTSGRRLTQKIGTVTTTYGYDNAGEMTTATPSTGTASSYTYDVAGRRLTDTTGTTAVTYTYDGGGRATGISRNTAGTVTSATRTHLPTGLVAASTSAGVTHRFDWSPTGDLLAWQRADTTTTLNGGPGGWAAMTQGPTRTGLGIDIYGSALSTTGTSSVARATAYSAFGIPTGTNTFDARLGFRGELTVDTLTNLRARDYQANTGIFVARDPLADSPGTPTVGNSYHYAFNDPLNQADPTGLHPTDADLDASVCSGRGGQQVDYRSLHRKICVMAPSSRTPGAPCRPPISSNGLPIVVTDNGDCGEFTGMSTECAHGRWLQDLNVVGNLDFICRHHAGITKGLVVIAGGALVVASGGLIAGIGAIPIGGGGALGLAGGGTVGAGALVIPAAVVQTAAVGVAGAAIAVAGAQALSHVSSNSGETQHGGLRGGEGDRNIDATETRAHGEQFYDSKGNQVFVERLPGGKSNVTVVNPATGRTITSYPRATSSVESDIASGKYWKLNG